MFRLFFISIGNVKSETKKMQWSFPRALILRSITNTCLLNAENFTVRFNSFTTHHLEMTDDIWAKISFEFFNWFLQIVVEIFFREVSFRGSFHLPSSGPTILVVAPHANQYLDAAIATIVTHEVSGRQVRMIEAASSYRSKWMGIWSRWSGAIPVERPQDLLKSKPGTIRYDDYPNDKLTVTGTGTHFTTDSQAKGLLGLPKSGGQIKIAKVLSDTKLVLAGPVMTEAGIDLLKKGTTYKLAPRIDNHDLFDNVFNELHGGAIIGIAPEGGSHDRPQLIDLKPGVAIMALGTVAKYLEEGTEVSIVPCGLNYFHPHKFRSRAVAEYGKPIVVTREMGEEYKKDARAAVNKLMKCIETSLKTVTTQAPDYQTLQVIQAARRLYSYGRFSNPPLPVVVEINRNLLIGYSKFKDDSRIQHLKHSVLEYNKKLQYLGIRDHQVEAVNGNFIEGTILLIHRILMLVFYSILSLPGTILFSPIFIACRKISKDKQVKALKNSIVKIKATDVLASWKVLVALFFAPLCYFIYSLLGTWLSIKYQLLPFFTSSYFGIPFIFCSIWMVLVLATFSALKMGESGMDVLKSIKPLYLSLISSTKELSDLRDERAKLSLEVTEIVNELGPKVFSKFNDETHLNKLADDIEDEYEIVRLRSRSRSGSRSRSSSRSRPNISRTGSQMSGFSEFGTDEEGNGKLPNLSHVSIFPDTYSNVSVSSSDSGIATGSSKTASGELLTNRVRDKVLQRNREKEL